MAVDSSMRQTVAAQLKSGARAFAAGAAEELLESSPQIGARHGAGAYFMWQGFLSQRVTELSTAVELDEPSLFTAELNWLYSTLAARDVAPEDVRLSLGYLGRALERELSATSWEIVRPTISLAQAETPMSTEPVSRFESLTETVELARTFMRAALDGDASRATNAVLDGFRSGAEAEALYERVMLPAQAEIGNLWQRGDIGIADEHVATEVIRTAMTALWLEATGGSIEGPSVVVGSVTGDRHDSGVRAAAYLIDISEMRGVFLGCDVPAEEFAISAARFDAIGAVVSASMSVHLPRIRQTAETIKAALPELRVVVGGPAFGMADDVASRLAVKLGADAYARTPTAAALLIAAATPETSV